MRLKRRKRIEDSRIMGLTSFVATGSRSIERYQTPEIQGMPERERERERDGLITSPCRCVDRRYSPDLPTASVVIIFHNEAYTVLLRTITSVINRSPAHLLQEIILVDDFSDHGNNNCTCARTLYS